MPLKKLRNQLCQGTKKYCHECFVGTQFEAKQNPPNVFRTANFEASRPIAFVFDKPNDNTKYRDSELVPITIYDDRAGIDPRLPRAPSHSTLIVLCRLLGLIAQNSNCLESHNLYITNAVKCDKCSDTGKTGRVRINDKQTALCRDRFIMKELQAVNARALIFFGINAQKYTLGWTTHLWEIHEVQLNCVSCWVMRVPHTAPTPFNTHGGRGQNYIAPFNELCRRANIRVMRD